MKLHNITISIIIVSMIVLGSITYLNSLGENYGVDINTGSFDGTQSRLEKQQNLSSQLNEDISSLTLELKVSDLLFVPYKMIKIGWSSLKLVFNSWATVGTIVEESSSSMVEDVGIPLPSWLVPSIISILVITLVALIIYGFFKWKFED